MSLPLSPRQTLHLDIAQVRTQVDDEDALLGMLAMLQDALARDLPAIAALLESGDAAAANQLLHALKGFIPVFCRPPLGSQLVQVELISKRSDTAATAQAYAALRPALELLQAEAAQFLQDRAAST